jgi:RimJ/RimL family protein N-acetyltransferase
MTRNQRWVVSWRRPDEHLRAYQPTVAETGELAPVLAGFYNDAHNRTMMANTVAMTAAEVTEQYAGMYVAGGKPFVLERNGVPAGDADFRHVEATTAEFAILIGQRGDQGKGLGTRFAILLHAWAFLGLGLERVFVSIIPANAASQRLFEKLGYGADYSPAARAFADDDSDLTLSLDRAAFVARHAAFLPEIHWQRRA